MQHIINEILRISEGYLFSEDDMLHGEVVDIDHGETVQAAIAQSDRAPAF